MSDSSYLDYFPCLNDDNHSVTSPWTPKYNCIAWAVDRQDKQWWPEEKGYWPKDVPRECTLNAFTAMFKGLGYEVCPDEEIEEGYEKIAIFATPDMKPTHAARQLANGRWTSKLGKLQDIEHLRVDDINCVIYGTPVQFMRRRRHP